MLPVEGRAQLVLGNLAEEPSTDKNEVSWLFLGRG